MSPRRPRRRARRRSPAGPVILLIAAVVVLVLIVGGLTQVSRQSQGYDANSNRSLGGSGRRRGRAVQRHVVGGAQPDERPAGADPPGPQNALDSVVQQTADESARADVAAGSNPLGSVAGQFATVFAERAQSVADLRAAVDGFLGMQPIPVAGSPAATERPLPRRPPCCPPPRRRTASLRLVRCSPVRTRSTARCGDLSRPPPARAGFPRPSGSPTRRCGNWAAWPPRSTSSPPRPHWSVTHDVVLRTVRLNPPALPTPQGVSASVSVLSPTVTDRCDRGPGQPGLGR